MSFWTSPKLEPHRQHRFRVVFTRTKSQDEVDKLLKIEEQKAKKKWAQWEKKNKENANRILLPNNFLDDDAVAAAKAPSIDYWWNVKSCTLPSYEIAMSDYQLINHKFKYPGMLVWNDVTITMVDTGTTMQSLMGTLGLAGYSKGKTCGSGISKGGFSRTGQFRIQMLDAKGNSRQQWHLDGWFIRSVRFGDLNYENDDLVTIELTIGYDWANLEGPTVNATGVDTLKQIGVNLATPTMVGPAAGPPTEQIIKQNKRELEEQ